jgi:hypothetical protein
MAKGRHKVGKGKRKGKKDVYLPQAYLMIPLPRKKRDA